MNDQRFYELVAQELQRRFIRPGLWARAVAETGDEGKTARALYIRLRVAELQEEQVETQQRASEQRQREPRPDWVYIVGAIVVVWGAAFIWKNFIE